mgnify:CR=1 FL=1
MSPLSLGILTGLLLFGIPISFAIVLGSAWAGWERGLPPMLLAQRLFTGLDSFPLMAVPLFMLAGELMNESGITRRIIRLADAFVGHLRTGLAQVAILSSIIFAGISGSAVADASALGRVFIPSMEKEGYTRDFSSALVAAAAVIGPIIPPSIPMIIFALIVQESVAALFLAGIIPGLLMGIGLAATSWVSVRKTAPQPKPPVSFRELLQALRQGIIPLLMPVIILYTILSGVVTPTEAAAVAVLYALFVGLFILRTLNLKILFRAFSSSMLIAAVILFIMASANLVNWLLTTQQIPQHLAELVVGQISSPVVFLLMVNVLLLIVGCFLEGLAAIAVLVPILMPISNQLGVDPVHFGTIVVVNLMVGMITPPMGILLFVVDGIARIGLARIVRQITPFLFALLVVPILLVFFPILATGLPRYFGY